MGASRLRAFRIVALAVAASFASTGCGKDADDREDVVPIMTCNLEAIAECDEIVGGMSIMQLTSAQWACAYKGGSYSFTARCPTTSVIGTCSIVGAYGGADLIERYYPPTDPASAEASCEGRFGVWASSGP